MTPFETLPAWIALPAALLVVIGTTLTFLGALGFVNLRNFYDRLHAPTLGTSWGALALLLASIAVNSWNAGSLVLHELVIGCFLMITMPITLMLLGRAALYRDRVEQRGDVPVFGATFHPSKADDGEEETEEPDPLADYDADGAPVEPEAAHDAESEAPPPARP